MNKSTGFVLAGLGCMPFLLIVVFNVLIGGFCTEYTVEYWGSFITGRTVDIPFMVAAVVGLFLGELFIPAALVTWILSFVLICTACQ